MPKLCSSLHRAFIELVFDILLPCNVIPRRNIVSIIGSLSAHSVWVNLTLLDNDLHPYCFLCPNKSCHVGEPNKARTKQILDQTIPGFKPNQTNPEPYNYISSEQHRVSIQHLLLFLRSTVASTKMRVKIFFWAFARIKNWQKTTWHWPVFTYVLGETFPPSFWMLLQGSQGFNCSTEDFNKKSNKLSLKLITIVWNRPSQAKGCQNIENYSILPILYLCLCSSITISFPTCSWSFLFFLRNILQENFSGPFSVITWNGSGSSDSGLHCKKNWVFF